MQIKPLQWGQVGVLAAGNIIAWSTVFRSYQAFFAAGGKVFQFTGCSVANPLATPCFYGALAFFIAIIWTARQILNPSRTARNSYRNLFYLLMASTIFGWGNVLYEYYLLETGPIVACGARTVTSVFQSSCLYGTLAFTIAFIISFLVYNSKKQAD